MPNNCRIHAEYTEYVPNKSKQCYISLSNFTKPCSLRSHRFVNPTPNNGVSHFLALPTYHPKKDSKIVIERVKNEILENTVEKKKISVWNTTAYNVRFCEMAAVIPQKEQCLIANFYPAAISVEAATSQSRRDDRRKFRSAHFHLSCRPLTAVEGLFAPRNFAYQPFCAIAERGRLRPPPRKCAKRGARCTQAGDNAAGQ
jgi:hypothetical protein